MPVPDRAHVLAVLPARNEEDALPGVLSRLKAQGITRILVVDNGSTDQTAAVAGAGGAGVVHAPRPGYGRACLRALEEVIALGPDVRPTLLLFLDADGSDDIEAVAKLLEPLEQGRADLVIGQRVGVGDAPLRQRGGTRLMVTLARWLHGVRASDLGPFRALCTEALLDMRMDDPTWGWTLQMQIRAQRMGLGVLEVPVRRLEREAGTSKISGSFWMSLRVGARMFWVLIRELRWRPRPGV